jgi:hypothetical protein
MRNGSSESGCAPTAGDGAATQTSSGRDPGTGPELIEPSGPPRYSPTEVDPSWQLAEIVRYGPGVPAALPAGRAELTAERVWRAGRASGPSRRRVGVRRLFGPALTVILLAASGIVLHLRFQHAPFQVTGVVISQLPETGCGVDVTGQITTNGSSGTVSYQWLVGPQGQPPQPLSQSVAAGQHTAYVTVAVDGAGHGTASQSVTL